MAAAVTSGNALVPPLFRWEMQNALASAVRRKRITTDEASENIAALDRLDLIVDDSVLALPMETGFGLLQGFHLTAYDAAYLELALRRSLPVMTRDEKLKRAASALRILWKP